MPDDRVIRAGTLPDYGGRATYPEREGLYAWVYAMLQGLGLSDGDTVLDVGAGYCDLDVYLRSQGWFGRYVPVDACIDPGVDLEVWRPSHAADYVVCVDTLEHVREWRSLVTAMRGAARKAVVVTTADADSIDVLAMHESHVSAITGADLASVGLSSVSHPLGHPVPHYAQLVGWWRR